MRFAASAVVLLAFVGQAGAADFFGGWESGRIVPPWDLKQIDLAFPAKEQILIQSRVHRWGRKYSARFAVQPGQQFSDTSGERAEVVKLNRAREGDVYWYSWSTLIPQSWRSPSIWAIIFNAHGTLPAGQAPLVVNIDGEAIELVINGGVLSTDGAAPFHFELPLVSSLHRGRWQNFAIRIRWSLLGGSVSAYWKLAGYSPWRHVQDVVGISTMQSYDGITSPIYIKHGLYRNAEAYTSFLYHDRFRRTRAWPFPTR